MPFESLARSLESKPRVLAGPILRKVTPRRVSVWLALRRPCTVTLKVFDEDGKRAMEGSQDTVAVGRNLHIVVVTAKKNSHDPDLFEGIVYRYDLTFDFNSATTGVSLADATGNAPLAYSPFTLPTFCLTPRDPNSLRLLQGSCRMPHAQGKDTLPIVDDLLMQSAANAFARPQQIFMNGDQIYADDVGDTLLLMLTDAGDTLLGWPEILPPDNLLPAQLPSYWREKPLTDAGFTSEDLRSHLISLGEFLSMYLFTWSDVLWPAPAALPTIDELFDKINFGGPQDSGAQLAALREEVRKTAASRNATIKGDIKSIAEYRSTLFKVRRAMANIQTYMIFDDHEVTDDWNMTRDFCRDLYGKPLGQRVVRNALLAYALCQHWGNVPEKFLDTPDATAGRDLLKLLDTPNPTAPNAFDAKAAKLEQNASSITSLLGVHNETVLATRPAGALFHDPHSLEYNYTVEGAGHQVIVTDTRTWRGFPDGGNNASMILPKDQIQNQILNTPSTGDRVLLVVLSTNAPPVGPIRAAAKHAALARTFEHNPDVYEAWEAPSSQVPKAGKEIPSMAFDRLLKALTDKLPLDSNRQHAGPVILFSGDVHFSFASRLIYRATNRFEDTTPQPATAVFAQLVASAFKKETGSTRGFQREGYTYAPAAAHALFLIPPHVPEGYVGWNVSTKTNVGDVVQNITRIGPDAPQSFSVKYALELNQPTTVEREFMVFTPGGTTLGSLSLKVAPHYRYRLDYLLPTYSQVQVNPPPIPAPPPGSTIPQRKQAAQPFRAATAQYRVYNWSSQPPIVGVNNFSEVTFDWSAGSNKKVKHVLRWWDTSTPNAVAVTTYTVSLDPNDPSFPDLKAKQEP